MILLFLAGIVGMLIVVNHVASRNITTAQNVGAWLIAIMVFALFLSVASLVGAALPGMLASVP